MFLKENVGMLKQEKIVFGIVSLKQLKQLMCKN